MITVGIDVASTKHDYFFLDSDGVAYGPFKVPNTKQGFKKLHKDMLDFVERSNYDIKDVRIGLEATGIYSKNILRYFVNLEFNVYLINPLLTHMSLKSASVRKTKTDKADCKAICRYLLHHKDNKPYTTKSYHIEALKSLSRLRKELTQNLAKEKTKLIELLMISFPEFITLTKDIFTKTSLSILENYPTITHILKARVGLTNVIGRKYKGLSADAFAKKLKLIAEDSIGDTSEHYAYHIKYRVKQIINLQDEIKCLETKIEELVKLTQPVITTIPGIGNVTAGLILGEIGDIDNFNSPDQLLAYAGCDPKVYQSGNYNLTNTHVSKRGSKYLRWALFIAAGQIRKFDPTFKAYYEKKKISQDKHYLVALGHVTKKLVRVLFSILKNNKEYISCH